MRLWGALETGSAMVGRAKFWPSHRVPGGQVPLLGERVRMDWPERRRLKFLPTPLCAPVPSRTGLSGRFRGRDGTGLSISDASFHPFGVRDGSGRVGSGTGRGSGPVPSPGAQWSWEKFQTSPFGPIHACLLPKKWHLHPRDPMGRPKFGPVNHRRPSLQSNPSPPEVPRLD